MQVSFDINHDVVSRKPFPEQPIQPVDTIRIHDDARVFEGSLQIRVAKPRYLVGYENDPKHIDRIPRLMNILREKSRTSPMEGSIFT